MKTPAPPAAIKWTDEEWSRIADKLHGEKGDALLRSENLEEIKARDVFEAQQVLPAERHRKLISIAQGFQGIRSRLHTIFVKMEEQRVAAASVQEAEAEAPANEAAPRSEAAAQQVLALHAPAVEKAEASAPAIEAPAGSAASTPDPEDAPEAAPATPATPATPAASDFIEMARPFVAMVCDEFAKALARALAGQGGLAALAARPGAKPEAAPARPRQGGERPRPQQQPQQQVEAAPPRAPAPEVFEEDAAHPTEVQPLFDPKLPPSANSDFKPTIGLVATRAHEYEDLQLLYPQLQLLILQADAIRGPDAFRNCQRIIGLRDEVPPAVDEMLRRSLRHRYVRLNGGAARVREQLNSWLDKPGSINSAPRAQPRNDKRPGQGNGKKRHKWPPRADR
jgi:hypothetical protein